MSNDIRLAVLYAASGYVEVHGTLLGTPMVRLGGIEADAGSVAAACGRAWDALLLVADTLPEPLTSATGATQDKQP